MREHRVAASAPSINERARRRAAPPGYPALTLRALIEPADGVTEGVRPDDRMNQDKIIAIETSGRQGSLALAIGPDLLAEVPLHAEAEHARDLIPLLDKVLTDHGWSPGQIDQCHVSIGPGSFTGLRVAVAFARHLVLACGVRLCAVPSLDVIAESCTEITQPPARLAAILNARRREVFAAVFEHRDGRYHRVAEPRMIEPSALLATEGPGISITGDGIESHRDAFEAAGVTLIEQRYWRPSAANVHRLGWRLACAGDFTASENLTPFYLRRPEAEEVWEKRHGTTT